MTLRERIADWISGGAVWDAKYWREVAFEQIERSVRAEAMHAEAKKAIQEIQLATRNVTNGTGQKINRMAREALGDKA